MRRFYWVALLILLPLSLMAEGKKEPTPSAAAGAVQFPYTGPMKTYTVSFYKFWRDVWASKNLDNSLVATELKKRLGNVELQWVENPGGDKEKVMFASGTLADIHLTGDVTNVANQYGPEGLFLELSQYARLMPNLQKLAAKFPFAVAGKQPDGKYWAYSPVIVQYDSWDVLWAMNGFYLKKGFKAPETTDDLYKLLQDVKKLNPNSSPFMLSYNYYIQALSGFLMTGGLTIDSSVTYDWTTKKYVFPLLQNPARSKEIISYIAKLYNEALFPQDFLTQTQEQSKTIIGDPKGDKWVFGRPGSVPQVDTLIETVQKTEPTFDIVDTLPPASTAGGLRWVWPYQRAGGRDHWGVFVNAKVKDPEFVASLLDYLMSDQIEQLTTYGVEGVTYKKGADGTPVFMPQIKWGQNPGGTVDPFTTYGIPSHWAYKPFCYLTPMPRILFLWYWTPRSIPGVNLYRDYYTANVKKYNDGTDNPLLSADDSEKISAIMNPIMTYVNEELAKFVVGRRALSEWDDFIAGIKQRGDPQTVINLLTSKTRPITIAQP